MALLFLSELHAFLTVDTHEHMVVDASLGDKLQINVDVSFLAINCRGARPAAAVEAAVPPVD